LNERKRPYIVLTVNTLAFTVCFAAWMMYGVLITFLVDNQVFDWDKAQMGWLIGIPVLTGAVARLPVGMLTDAYGGRIVFGTLLFIAAVPMFMVSFADSYVWFLLTGLGFGLSGAAFAVGIAYTSVWFSRERQGTALGIFGAGNAGAALTSMGAPIILKALTDDGANLDGWRTLPQMYAALLAITGVIFFALTTTKKVENIQGHTITQRLAPLRNLRVWRFGLYYFLVFGGFVALAQWLVPYYVSTYSMTVATAGLMAAIFSLPSGVIRALGGWMSDNWGARTVMYWVLGTCVISFLFLIVPRMDIQSPGEGITAARSGTVTSVSASEIVVDQRSYQLNPKKPNALADRENEGVLVFPTSSFWHEPVVQPGDEVSKKELLARGVTNIFFQANVWIFTGLVFVAGIAMGIGKAAVYKHIPDYFPDDVGVVGGMVGVLGGLGGFVCPVIFGYLLRATGIWTTSWMFLAILSAISLVWMHLVIQRMMRKSSPAVAERFEEMPRVVALNEERT
jgi:NNP family nitrate/nitrite transporter-like MFS transporter|tara:strand:- start:2166 stop:3692 length:1527 start_codon:yes stop_codon:yes gene_type:complete